MATTTGWWSTANLEHNLAAMSAQRRFTSTRRSRGGARYPQGDDDNSHGFANTIFVVSRSGAPRSPLRPATELLVEYARFHRDRRNIASHFVGVPLIVLALGILFGRLQLGGFNLAWLLWGASTLWYLTRGKLVMGVVTSAAIGGLIALAQPLAMTDDWLAWGLGGFAAGWFIQVGGHYFEGRKPGFVDDLIGQLIGPMFVVAEALMAVGLERETRIEIELGAGSTHLRDLKAGGAR
ncbi:MAG: hypothetical protein RL375_2329 [Pseudomonadota bacterium]